MKRTILLILSLIVVVASVFYTDRLASQLAEEETKKVEIWAEATRLFFLAGPDEDINFVATIIEGNTTIPVCMTDADGKYLLSRNINLPARLQKPGKEEEALAYYQHYVDKLRKECQPISVELAPDNIQYLYYDESRALKHLHYLPYIQFMLIIAFLLVVIVSLTVNHRAEENRVWVGLCKETAHQLGTPISSLNAWNELLRSQYPDDPSFPEIDHDIHRLTTIAERFSKIGSDPVLTAEQIVPLVRQTVAYMQTRTSDKVSYSITDSEAEGIRVMINAPLFAWVIENLIRNAVDAMNGEGAIAIRLYTEGKRLMIDVHDTGRGIERHQRRRVFQPGYTTKTRGWGLGLSLAKRIIEDYHHGKIFVADSEKGQGTTFRIVIKTLF